MKDIYWNQTAITIQRMHHCSTSESRTVVHRMITGRECYGLPDTCSNIPSVLAMFGEAIAISLWKVAMQRPQWEWKGPLGVFYFHSSPSVINFCSTEKACTNMLLLDFVYSGKLCRCICILKWETLSFEMPDRDHFFLYSLKQLQALNPSMS